jgi:hypothetical protein
MTAKIRWQNSRLDFLVSRRPLPHSLSSKRPNHQHAVFLVSDGAIEGHFEGKTPRRDKVTKGILFLHDNPPTHWALSTQKKVAYLGFQ